MDRSNTYDSLASSSTIRDRSGSNPLSSTTSSISHLSITPNNTVTEEVLSTAVDEVLKQCPKFRILVLGKSGAGKSSLINSTFNVDTANVSHELAGVSDINYEHTSVQNSRFILHDSQGFAHGEIDNFKTVESFIRERTDPKRPLKDRLHAIWFCVEVPTANGALFEKGEEKIFELKLENVPIIVVFTKYDELVSKLENDLDSELENDEDELDDEQFDKLVQEKARQEFSQICVKPLEVMMGDHPLPFLEVSTKRRYRKTLEGLMQLTRHQLDDAVWLTWAIAQNTDASLKIDASIAIGRKSKLKSSVSSLISKIKGRNRVLARNIRWLESEAFLNVIHDEIVAIWNFNDPHMYCTSSDFKAVISHLVRDLSDQPPMERMRRLISVTGLTGVVTSAVPGAVVIALPVAAGLVFAQWVYMAYRSSPSIIRLLMGYIVGKNASNPDIHTSTNWLYADLVLVMQSLFWIIQARGQGQVITRPLLRIAFEAYESSEGGELTRIHNAITSFITSHSVTASLFKFKQKDLVLEKVEELITNNRFKPPQSVQDRVKSLSDTVLNDPEQWFFEDPIGYFDQHQQQADESRA
ncbi:hypothetical protein V5O48_007733 [Marasmius crinis-equi]|uniref:G domain-containing protein n=1 Tax=Marasmius crinis-equi TaxID=585013 RepID=A0ABR3FFU1_9AGAR